jgi:hypothetical protein
MTSAADGRFPGGLSSAKFREKTSQNWIFRRRLILRESPSYSAVIFKYEEQGIIFNNVFIFACIKHL